MGFTTFRFHPDQADALQRLLRSVITHDGDSALSEHKEIRVGGGLDAREIVACDTEGNVVGYGQAAWHRGSDADGGHWALEVVVAPSSRAIPVAEELIETLHDEAGGHNVILWARSDYVAAAASAVGWHSKRRLLEMRRDLPIDCVLEGLAGYALTTFRMGVDEQAWLEANNATFAGHPENGSVTRRDLEHRITQAWFDPDGFFLAWDRGQLAGSCWTKIHEDGVGEIYIVGVTPGWEGRGLGQALVCHGLDYLSSVRHVTRGMLFVEEKNSRAISLYERLGFEHTRSISAFQVASASPEAGP